jgi:hypothetical protein
MTRRLLLIPVAMLVLTTGCGAASQQSSQDAAESRPKDPAASTPPAAAAFGRTVDNPWMPWRPGTTWHFVGTTADGTERTVVTVTHRRHTVQGVATTVVHDVVHLDGALLEDTDDYYAQDGSGNVWYFGEDTKEYDGTKVDTSGSWQSGVDGARAGIAMPAHPEPGDRYFQEYYPGEAMDQGQVLRTDASANVPFGHATGLLETKDFTRLEPKADEHKYYEKGVGVVLEKSLHEQDVTRLVSMTRP